MAWILRLVRTGAEGEGRSVDVMEINRSGGLGDIAGLGLTLDETKRLLARACKSVGFVPGPVGYRLTGRG